jgi:hypothetical protein
VANRTKLNVPVDYMLTHTLTLLRVTSITHSDYQAGVSKAVNDSFHVFSYGTI